jgi:hypothetical protein
VAANAASGAVKLFSSKRRVAAAAVVILLVLFLLRPGVSRLKARITNSISQAVARPAEIGSVHLRFLPRPGFDLENLVIHEDPAFGAEPMLRAPEVTAVVRLTSLLRGRLDICSSGTDRAQFESGAPSRRALELGGSARTHGAHSAGAHGEIEARIAPGFPYIEASSGRINFKAGQEKKPYALAECRLCCVAGIGKYLGSAPESGAAAHRYEFERHRLLRMNGTWQRAGSLRETPLQFSLEWHHAQLGQLTKLVSGNDKGWRGDVRLEATLSGIPAAMQVTADASIQDFHRYDISSSEGLRLAGALRWEIQLGRRCGARGLLHSAGERWHDHTARRCGLPGVDKLVSVFERGEASP